MSIEKIWFLIIFRKEDYLLHMDRDQNYIEKCSKHIENEYKTYLQNNIFSSTYFRKQATFNKFVFE